MPLHKTLKDSDIKISIKTVQVLNREIKNRFLEKNNLRLTVWASDLHLHHCGEYTNDLWPAYDYVDTSRQFTMCLHEINALDLKPDCIMLGGDITDTGIPDEWREFKRIMTEGAWEVCTLPVLGNHDNNISPIKDEIIDIWPEISQHGWPGIEDPNALYYSRILNGLKYIILDTVRHSLDQRISDRQRAWLEAEIKQAEVPVMIFLHVHILPAGNWTDEGGAYRDKEILRTIHQSPNVLGVFSGHSHIPSLWQYRRKIYGTFPSVAYGIGGSTGWGGILFNEDGIAAVFYKELPGDSFDDCTGLSKQEGKFVFMEPKLFQRHPLLNPFFWYREADPSKRD